MSNLVAITFKTETGAGEMLQKVGELQKQALINVQDAATAIRGKNGKVKVRQATSLVGAGTLGGAFWGMLFGLLFFAPFLGMALGAATGALLGKASDYGINDDFIKKVSNAIKPGNSALFLLIESAQADRVIEELKPMGGTIVYTSLSQAEEKQLKEAFA